MKSYMSYAVVAFLLVVMAFLVTCSKGQEKSEGITLQVFAYLDRTDSNASRSFDRGLYTL